jgi:hypothetical protein
LSSYIVVTFFLQVFLIHDGLPLLYFFNIPGSNGLSSAIRVAIYFAEEQVTEQMHDIELSKPRMGTTEKRQTKISEWHALGGKWEGGRDWCVNEDGTWSPIKAPQFTLGIDSPGFASTQPTAQSLTVRNTILSLPFRLSLCSRCVSL